VAGAGTPAHDLLSRRNGCKAMRATGEAKNRDALVKAAARNPAVSAQDRNDTLYFAEGVISILRSQAEVTVWAL
jgi:hypothetical protein